MQFLATSDQQGLIDGIRDLLKQFDRSRLAAVRGGFDAALWQQLSDTGVFSIRVPESEGGLGMGWVETSLVTQELGRACVPGPIVASLLAPDFGLKPGTVTTAAFGGVLSHADVSSKVLTGSEAVELQTTKAIDEPVDPHTPLHRTELADAVSSQGAMLAAAFQVGIAYTCIELAVAYAKEREQFGKTIASFQAIKHMCADMLARAEVARAAVDAAALSLDGLSFEDPARAVASAKILADEAAVLNARAAIQVYGGMGFTWEVELHYYLKRAWVLSSEWGTVDDHSELLAEML